MRGRLVFIIIAIIIIWWLFFKNKNQVSNGNGDVY